MVLYEIDGNYIDAEPMKDSRNNLLVIAYQSLWVRVTIKGTVKPQVHILDNEASAFFKTEIRKNCDLQTVPLDMHRCNLAERAIQTFKNHFISILAGIDPSFPMYLWDRLIPQAILMLNLLHQLNTVQTISAYQHVQGNVEYNKMPLAPLGCTVQMHKSTK
jgi:hypothetical protein